MCRTFITANYSKNARKNSFLKRDSNSQSGVRLSKSVRALGECAIKDVRMLLLTEL
jgi:hypothetical protein